LGKYKAFTQKKRLKIWDDEIELLVQQKNLACKKYLHTKTIDHEIEYKRRRVIAKIEIRKVANPENNSYQTSNLTHTK
jgi:hypothetical protein